MQLLYAVHCTFVNMFGEACILDDYGEAAASQQREVVRNCERMFSDQGQGPNASGPKVLEQARIRINWGRAMGIKC